MPLPVYLSGPAKPVQTVELSVTAQIRLQVLSKNPVLISRRGVLRIPQCPLYCLVKLPHTSRRPAIPIIQMHPLPKHNSPRVLMTPRPSRMKEVEIWAIAMQDPTGIHCSRLLTKPTPDPSAQDHTEFEEPYFVPPPETQPADQTMESSPTEYDDMEEDDPAVFSADGSVAASPTGIAWDDNTISPPALSLDTNLIPSKLPLPASAQRGGYQWAPDTGSAMPDESRVQMFSDWNDSPLSAASSMQNADFGDSFTHKEEQSDSQMEWE
ncbi:hypothetical protein IAT40_000631 [Kwoniella sp. CBS 6097]